MHQGRDIIVIGASTGGVEAVRRIVRLIPAELPAAVFLVVHAWPDIRSFLVPILAGTSALPVREATNGEPIVPGVVYVAPGDQHMMLEPERVLLVHGPRENRARPAINPLFRSAAESFGPRVVGVILTGVADDGAAGLWAVKRCGGVAVVQDPSDALFPEMPTNAILDVDVDYRVTLEKLPPLLVKLAEESFTPTATAAPPESIKASNQGIKMEPQTRDMDKLGQRTPFSCPECGGALWKIEGGQDEYRCHVGHAYSPQILAAEQNVVIEQSLWSAIRALKESAAMDQRLAARSAQLELDKAAAIHRANAEEKQRQIEELMQLLKRPRPDTSTSPS